MATIIGNGEVDEHHLSVLHPIAVLYQDSKSSANVFRLIEPISVINGSDIGLKKDQPFLMATDWKTNDQLTINTASLITIFPATSETMDILKTEIIPSRSVTTVGEKLDSIFRRPESDVRTIEEFGLKSETRYQELLDRVERLDYSMNIDMSEKEDGDGINEADFIEIGIRKAFNSMRIKANSVTDDSLRRELLRIILEGYDVAPSLRDERVDIDQLLAEVKRLNNDVNALTNLCAKHGLDTLEARGLA